MRFLLAFSYSAPLSLEATVTKLTGDGQDEERKVTNYSDIHFAEVLQAET